MKRSHFFAGLSSAPLFVLPPGFEVHHQPSGFVVANGFVTGWKNEATGLVVATHIGNPIYTASDPAFAGHSSVRVSQFNALGKQPVGFGVSSGLTIAQVIKMLPNIQGPEQNGDGCMPWYMETFHGPIDVWTASGRMGYGINTFGGDFYGVDPAPTPPARFATQALTTTLVNGNSWGGSIFLNGTNISGVPRTNGPSHVFKGDVFPGFTAVQPRYSFDGYVAEFIVYPRVLSSDEIAAVHAYLKAKYNL